MSLTKSLTAQQMGEIHGLLAEEYGITSLEQIERAGHRLAETAQRLLKGSVAGQTIIVVAGPGNNGAVGLAAARFLHQEGATVRLVLSVKPVALHEMAAHQYTVLQELGLFAWGLSLSEQEMADLEPIVWTKAALIIDALLSSGIQSEPHGDMADLIRIVNAVRRPILSFDVPSGLSSDEGFILSPCIQASATMTLALPKRAQIEGWPVVRDLWVADIGVPHSLYKRLRLEVKDIFNGETVVCLGRARKLK